MANRMNRMGGEQQHETESSGGVMQAVRESAEGVASAAEQAWEGTSYGAQQAASAVATTAENLWDDARGCMARYPLATFFCGVTLGALAALAIERRYMHGRGW